LLKIINIINFFCKEIKKIVSFNTFVLSFYNYYFVLVKINNIMKIIPKIVILFTLMLVSTVYSQNCRFYIPLEENKGFKYKSYDVNDQRQGSQEKVIKNVISVNDHSIATIISKYFDKEDRIQHEGDFTLKCTDDETIIDIKSILDPSIMERYSDMNISMETKDIIIPTYLDIGQNLPDANMHIKISIGDVAISNINFDLQDRKVDSKESITVPAGTFDCYKISYNSKMKSESMGIPVELSIKHVEYHAPNVGMIRSETYDENGNLQGYTILNQIL